MSHFIQVTVVKDKKVLKLTASALAWLKAIVTVLFLGLYVYMLLVAKSWYDRVQKLDHLYEWKDDMRRQMMDIHKLDRSLASELEAFDEFREQFY